MTVPGVEPGSSRFQPGALPPELGGHGCGAEGVRTPGLRSAAPALCLLSYSPQESGARESNPACPAPKAGGLPSTLAPDHPDRQPSRALPAGHPFVMPSAVEFSKISTTGHAGVGVARAAGIEPTTHGFGDRCSTELSYTRIRKWGQKRKTPPVPAGEGGACHGWCAALLAPDPLVDPAIAGFGRSPVTGQDRLAAQR